MEKITKKPFKKNLKIFNEKKKSEMNFSNLIKEKRKWSVGKEDY